MFSERKLGLSAERLRELLHYAPETGLFYWRVSRGSVAAGTPAGQPHSHGYVVIRIDGVTHYAHRLAWLYVYGEHPTREIDHRNQNRADNSIANLPQSSHAENMRNISRRNRSGFKGVYRYRSKWGAQICVDGRRITSGSILLQRKPPPPTTKLRVSITGSSPERTKCLACCPVVARIARSRARRRRNENFAGPGRDS